MRARLGTIVCKFGGDRVAFLVEEAICAKFTDRQTDGQTDGRRTPRDCISSFQWNELIKIIHSKRNLQCLHTVVIFNFGFLIVFKLSMSKLKVYVAVKLMLV